MVDSRQPLIVVEDDPFPRILQAVLDPAVTQERVAAFIDFFSTDDDFLAWRESVRTAVGGMYPATVVTVKDQAELRAKLPGAVALVTESLAVGAEELAAGANLRLVQKYGTILRAIDTAACRARGVPVATQRRRSNIACAEMTLALMLDIAKKLHITHGLLSMEQLQAAGYQPKLFDRRHTGNSNWARVPGLRMLYESTLGIVGFGEIGRELSLRAAAMGMPVLYWQRTPIPAAEAAVYGATWAPIETLLAQSDYVSVQLPGNASTRHILDRGRIAQMKRGVILVNSSRSDLIERQAVLDALASGHLGGFGLDTPYDEPGSADDPLLAFPNVTISPHTAAQPRTNALKDLAEMMTGMAQHLGFVPAR
jgi:phosphoglycerate dehydrogenase-like enzyme